MKKIINGKLYDTDTAKYIGNYEYGNRGDFTYISETLYQKKTGEFILHSEGWFGGESIIPEHDFDVKVWVATYCDVDTYIELFGPVEE